MPGGARCDGGRGVGSWGAALPACGVITLGITRIPRGWDPPCLPVPCLWHRRRPWFRLQRLPCRGVCWQPYPRSSRAPAAPWREPSSCLHWDNGAFFPRSRQHRLCRQRRQLGGCRHPPPTHRPPSARHGAGKGPNVLCTGLCKPSCARVQGAGGKELVRALGAQDGFLLLGNRLQTASAGRSVLDGEGQGARTPLCHLRVTFKAALETADNKAGTPCPLRWGTRIPISTSRALRAWQPLPKPRQPHRPALLRGRGGEALHNRPRMMETQTCQLRVRLYNSALPRRQHVAKEQWDQSLCF